MVQYQMHPAIEACYETTPYNYKGILTAAQPWSGHYQVEPGLWVTAQFTQFIEPGWYYLDDGCVCTEAGGCLSLSDPRTGDVSIVILNRSRDPHLFSFHLKHLRADALHVWRTCEAQQFIRDPDLPVRNGLFEIEIPAGCIVTLTTTVGQQKGTFPSPPPAFQPFPLPYSDDFQGYPEGGQPRYAIDQGGAFEIAQEFPGKKHLRQTLDLSTRPVDWILRATPDPYTILGSPQLRNYQVSVLVRLESPQQPFDDGYVMVGARCNLAPHGNAPAECYNLCVFEDGQWHLRCGSVVLRAGILTVDWTRWHSVQLRCRDDEIEALFDGTRLASVQDQTIPSGQIVLGSGYHLAQFSQLRIDPLGDSPECVRYAASDPRLVWSGSWRETGCDANHYARTLFVSDQARDSLQFSFSGTSVCIVGMKNKNCGQFQIELDGETFACDTYHEGTQYRKALFSRSGLRTGTHKLRLTTTGTKQFASSGTLVCLTAIEVTGGDGLLG